MDKLVGKTVLITAAEQGIGRATAEMFAAQDTTHKTLTKGRRL